MNTIGLTNPDLTPTFLIQAIFIRLISQGGPSLNDEDLCQYRGYNGRRCAVGWCIPDDRYNDSMETDNGRNIARAMGAPEHLVPLLVDLQAAHDGNDTDNKYSDITNRTYLNEDKAALYDPDVDWPTWLGHRFQLVADHYGIPWCSGF